MNNKKFALFTQFIGFLGLKLCKLNKQSKLCKLFAFSSLLFALSSLLIALPLEAKVTGVCSNCHTMHNSQNGTAMRYDSSVTPLSMLLRGTCGGCHFSTGTTYTIVSALTGITTPIVYNTAGGTTDPETAQTWSGATYNLAGGNFYYTAGTGVAATDAKGHDVDFVDTTAGDSTLGNTPPGFAAGDFDESTTKYSTASRLTCSGSNGCHGDRAKTDPYAAIKGAHHTNVDGALDSATTVGNSFRFLKGVRGFEDPNWQQSATVAAISDHNEYKGALARGTLATTCTISALCRQCHGVFHDTVGIASPWLRHPTDTDVIGKGGEYAAYNSGVSPALSYSMLVPVGYTGANAPAPRQTVASGDSAVLCLSCHRAHASPYFKLIRWNYKSATLLTAISGCNVCHTSKN